MGTCYIQESIGSRRLTPIRIKTKLWPYTPPTVPKGPVLPWWPGHGTCLPLLSCILQGQPHTPSEVRCHPGLSLRSPLASPQPLTPTLKQIERWGREGGGRDNEMKHIYCQFYMITWQFRIFWQTCVFVVLQAFWVQACVGNVQCGGESLCMLQYVSLLWWSMTLSKFHVLYGLDS